MAARIDRATHSHAKCAQCSQPIYEAQPRVLDSATPSMLFHLDCAVDTRPDLVRKALLGYEPVDPGLVPDPNAVLARIRARSDDLAAERRAAAMEPPDPVLQPLYAQLEADPDDRGVIAVLADALAERGDPRGELITADLLAETRPNASMPGRRKIQDSLTPSFGETGAQLWWSRGFVRRCVVHPQSAPRTARLAPLWKHPSMRLLRELSVFGAAGPLMYAWFPALRRLELTAHMASIGPVGDIVAAMPRLEYLSLSGMVERIDLGHAALRELRLERGNDHVLHDLELARLPKLVRLTAIGTSEGTITALLRSGWCKRLDQLALLDTTIDEDFAMELESALDGRRLPHLDLTGSRIDCSKRALLPHCETLVARVAPEVGMSVRHVEKPEWGIGRVIAMSPGKVVIEFAVGGQKTLRDALPQLAFDED